MKKSFVELQAVINGNEWKAQHEAFGTHFAKDASAEYLSTVGNTMIARCQTWIENWQTELEGLKPELDTIRNKQLEATAEKFVGYTDEQLQALMAAIKQKQGLKNEAAPAA